MGNTKKNKPLYETIPIRVFIDEHTSIPLIKPLKYYSDFMIFDKAVCASGLKHFCRNLMPGDISDIAEIRNELIRCDLVVVREVQPGVRQRNFVKPGSGQWVDDNGKSYDFISMWQS